MVSGVQNSAGASAYLKGSQLGSSSGREPATFKKELTSGAPDSPSTKPAAETAKTEKTEKPAPTETRPEQKDTQLEAKNDNQTLQAEKTRGSLLDMAV